jgi:hypothetical protein
LAPGFIPHPGVATPQFLAGKTLWILVGAPEDLLKEKEFECFWRSEELVWSKPPDATSHDELVRKLPKSLSALTHFTLSLLHWRVQPGVFSKVPIEDLTERELTIPRLDAAVTAQKASRRRVNVVLMDFVDGFKAERVVKLNYDIPGPYSHLPAFRST